MSITVALLFFFVSSAIIVFCYFWHRSSYFRRRGIPGPSPTSIFSGSLFDYQDGSVPHETAVRWEREYGETYGFMEGSQRVIVTSNLDILNDVFNRKFEHFHARKPVMPYPANIDKDERVPIVSAQGLRWKRYRMLINPLFAISKLKAIEPTITDSIRTLVNVLETSATGHRIDIYPYFNLFWYRYCQQLMLDVIERVIFGKTYTSIGKHNPLLAPAIAFTTPAPFLDSWLIGFYVCTNEFQEITRHLHKFLMKLAPHPLKKLDEELTKKIDVRRTKRQNIRENTENEEDNNRDFIDFFLNAEVSGEQLRQLMTKGNGINKIAKKMTDEEIIANCYSFLIAGVDSTAITLANIVYELAMNDEIQQKLTREIDDYYENEDEITNDNVQNLSYLDWCIKETLRMNPVLSNGNGRICAKTCEVGNGGFVVEEGVCVMPNAWSIHYNRQLWGEDADRFCPERWDPNFDRIPKHPMAYQPFGAGPRKCMGMRLAMMEIKFSVCFLLKKFRFVKCNQTKLVRIGNFSTAPESVNIVLQKKFDRESD